MTARILVVEDDRFLLNAYAHLLEPEGYTVDIAKDGEEALEVLKTLRPDLIILDLIMPKKGGMEVLRSIRSNPALKTTPVIIATNISNTKDQEECERLGAVQYTIKTDVSLQQLLVLVKQTLQTK